MQEPHQAAKKLRTKGRPTYSLRPRVSPSNGHPNVEANRIAASELERFLIESALVPDPDEASPDP